MNENLENIDRLIDEHTDRQLSMVDWDRLHNRIQTRLDQAQNRSNIPLAEKQWLRTAVGISTAAVLLLAIFIFNHKKAQPIPLAPGRHAAVQWTEHNNVAETSIKNAADATSAIVIMPSQMKTQVRFSRVDRPVAQCEITIIDQNGREKKTSSRPSWVMMFAPESDMSENGTDAENELACLL